MRLHKKSFIRLICILTVTALLLCCAGVNSFAASSVSSLQNRIAELEKQAAKIEKDISKIKSDKSQKEKYKVQLQQSIDNYNEQISVCQQYLDSYNWKIEQLNANISETDAELSDTINAFKKRMRYIYMVSTVSSEMSVLVSADDFATHLSMDKFSKSVSSYDKKLINEVKDLLSSQKNQRAQVEQLVKEQAAIRQSLASKKSSLDKQVAELNGIINSLNSQSTKLNSQLEQINKDLDAYEAEMKRVYNEAKGTNAVLSGQFLWPVAGFYKITSPFGYRTHPITGEQGKLHKGADIGGSGIAGQPVLAAADGTVLRAEINGSLTSGYGRYVVINHGYKDGNLYTTHYAHLASYIVSPGQTVKRGQVIAYVGSSGGSTGYHLHFEIRVNGTAVNPMQFFSTAK